MDPFPEKRTLMYETVCASDGRRVSEPLMDLGVEAISLPPSPGDVTKLRLNPCLHLSLLVVKLHVAIASHLLPFRYIDRLAAHPTDFPYHCLRQAERQPYLP